MGALFSQTDLHRNARPAEEMAGSERAGFALNSFDGSDHAMLFLALWNCKVTTFRNNQSVLAGMTQKAPQWSLG